MKPPFFSCLVLVMSAVPWGCSERRDAGPSIPAEDSAKPAAAVVAVAPSPGPRATPDPAAAQRTQLAARVEALPDSECDYLVLEFQLIPRDEILDPLSTPKRELLRWVRRLASAEELAVLERSMNQRTKKTMRP